MIWKLLFQTNACMKGKSFEQTFMKNLFRVKSLRQYGKFYPSILFVDNTKKITKRSVYVLFILFQKGSKSI